MPDLAEPIETGGKRHSTAVRALIRVAAHYGLALNPQQLLHSHPFETDEPGINTLLKMAESTGLRGKQIRIRRGELAKLSRFVPVILLLPNGKAALIQQIERSKGATCAIVDELESERGVSVLYDEPRLFEFWAGDAILFKVRWGVIGTERPFSFRWLVDQLLLERHLFRDISIAAVMMSMLALAPLLIFMVMIDRVLVYRSMSTLQVVGVAIVAMITFETMFGYLRRHLIWVATSRIDARINLHIFDKLLNLPMSFFERVPTGLVSAKISQVWHIRQFLVQELFGTLLDSLTFTLLMPVLFILNWELALMVMGLGLAILGVYLIFLPSLRRYHARVVDAEQAMSWHQVETIYGIRTVKSLTLDGLKRKQRDERVADVVKAHQDFDRLRNIPQTITTPLERLVYGGSFFFGCYMAMSNSSTHTIGSVVAFAMLAGRVTQPVMELANVVNSFEEARGAMAEVASVVNVAPEEGRSGTGLKLPIKGRVVFQDVRFRYSPGASCALDGVSFEIPQGTIFGVMGRSGSGKTTVTRLLQGLNRDYEGMIKIDGMDLREIDLDHLRSSIGVVPQENFLFKCTVRENIAAARPRSSFDKIVRAAQLAGAEEFIERLPHGYDTVVEEGAANFSGGQRQRLAIARALLVDPPILILDEATSALDAESEAIVNANLLRIAQNRTVIIISHRLSALSMADSILVLERGKFYAVGHHQKLLGTCDIYQSLWSQQNRHLQVARPNADSEVQPIGSN